MKITSANYVISGTRIEHFPNPDKPEFMLCGRSNVGKSSFINMVLNQKNLARTSSKPGKTQTINFFLVNESFYFVDVPGYGYANVSKARKEEFGKMIEHYITHREVLKLVFLLVDFRHAPTSDDKLMYDYFKFYHIPVCIIATKIDKVNRSQFIKQKKLITETLGLDQTDLFIQTSTETSLGIEEVYKVIEDRI